MSNKIIRTTGRVAARVALPFFTYFLAALLLGLLPVNSGFVEPNQGVDIYLRFSPVHTDVMLPVRSGARDWSQMLQVPGIENAQYLSFGWGDRAFYLETKTWADLRASNAVAALIGIDSSLLHVSTEAQPRESENVVRIRITPQQLGKLTAQIDATLRRDANGLPRLIPGQRYDDNDAFFEALGNYSLLFTCNDWVRQLLHASGVRTALWAPFPVALRFHAARVRDSR